MHNKRKHHNKYTQKRIHNKTARAHKRKLRHTRHNPRHNITHKQRGGDGFLDKAKKFVSQTSTFLNKDEDKKELAINAHSYDTKEDLSSGAQNRADIIKAAAGASLLTTIGRVAVVGLSASGVGLPLAGVIATALIIAHVFAEINISNINLKSVMYDTLNIISNSYILNDYINYVETHMKNKKPQANASTEVNSGNTEEPNQIIKGLKERLKDKIIGLISYLLSIATDDMLTSLQRDKSATPAIRELVDAENAKRKGFSSFMARAGRVVDRTLKADRTISYIIRDISIINGYFMLVKSHFDLSLDAFERSLGTDNVKAFWGEVERGSDDTDTDLTKTDVIGEYNKSFVKSDKAKNPYMRYLYGGFNDKQVVDNALKTNPTNLAEQFNEKKENEKEGEEQQ